MKSVEYLSERRREIGSTTKIQTNPEDTEVRKLDSKGQCCMVPRVRLLCRQRQKVGQMVVVGDQREGSGEFKLRKMRKLWKQVASAGLKCPCVQCHSPCAVINGEFYYMSYHGLKIRILNLIGIIKNKK